MTDDSAFACVGSTKQEEEEEEDINHAACAGNDRNGADGSIAAHKVAD